MRFTVSLAYQMVVLPVFELYQEANDVELLAYLIALDLEPTRNKVSVITFSVYAILKPFTNTPLKVF